MTIPRIYQIPSGIWSVLIGKGLLITFIFIAPMTVPPISSNPGGIPLLDSVNINISGDVFARRGGGGGGRGGGRGGGGMSRGGGGFSSGGRASSGSFKSRPSASTRPSPSARPAQPSARPADRPGMAERPNQGGRQDNRGDRQDNRQDAMKDRQDDRQEFLDDHHDEYHHDHNEWYEYHGDYWAAAVVGASLTMAAWNSLACTRNTVIVDNITYYSCGGTWYQPAYSGGNVTYIVVNAPAGY